MSRERSDIVVVSGPGPRWFRTLLVLLALAYIAALLAGPLKLGNLSSLPTFRFFSQVSCLFPKAARMVIEYRVEGFRCEERDAVELDTRVYFPMHADNKENRLHRLGYFFRRNRPVMRSLDQHLVDAHNAKVQAGEPTEDGVDGLIGGIRLLSLRIPFPEPGEPVERYSRKPLESYPEEMRKRWYHTPRSLFEERCLELREGDANGGGGP